MKGKKRSAARRLTAALLVLLLLLSAFPLTAGAAEEEKEVLILFTHDIHSHLESYETETGESIGGAARLASLLEEEREAFGQENCLYLDGGDFSQGTLFQAGYLSDALELRLLGRLGCDYTTIGNHEWDLGGTGFAEMLGTAAASGERLPGLLCANLDFSGELTEEQTEVLEALTAYGSIAGCEFEYTVKTLENGLKVGLFGLSGLNSIEDSPTSGMKWTNYIEKAKELTETLSGQCDLIVCLSHAGTEDGENGEDIELAEACPEIDVILSAHSHTRYEEAQRVGKTLVVSCGEYMESLGVLKLRQSGDGSFALAEYRLEDLDETVPEDGEIAGWIAEVKTGIEEGYLAEYRSFFTELEDYSYDQVIAHASFDFTSLSEMYATHGEYPLGDLIADAYLYEAEKNGIDDIDVALVGLGTIRNSIHEGNVTLADAFEICSLGVGGDRSAGHPLITGYITGAELKLLLQLDSSLGPLVSSIKMSYSGIRYSFNTKRVLLDRVTEAYLVKEDGTEEELESDKLYKICCNLYAANMLGMLNSLTKGVLKIQPKDENGAFIGDFSARSMKTADGREIKEWVAFADYLSSFEKNGDGISEIPYRYSSPDGRKYKYSQGGALSLRNPGLTTVIAVILFQLLVLLLVLLVWKIIKKTKRQPAERHRDRDRGDSTELLEGKEKRHRDRSQAEP